MNRYKHSYQLHHIVVDHIADNPDCPAADYLIEPVPIAVPIAISGHLLLLIQLQPLQVFQL